MEKNEYVSLLESAVANHSNAPVKDIVNWGGHNLKGDLPTTLKDSDLDGLIDKITKGDKTEDQTKLAGKTVKEDDDKSKSPLSVLEDNLFDGDDGIIESDELDTELNDDLSEDSVNFCDKESDILNRLISEMDALDSTSDVVDDEFDDNEEIGGPAEDDEIDVDEI